MLLEEEENKLQGEEEEIEEDSSESKIKREYKKKKKLINKTKTKVQQAFIAKLQFLMVVAIVVVVLCWGGVKTVLNWFSGQEEITISAKAIRGDCYEVTATNSNSYCVDQESYERALEGRDYLLEEYQYSFKLREVPQQWILGK